MTTLAYLRDLAIPGAYALLPPVMASKEATAMLIAIGLQESKCCARFQRKGPARGFWQFEEGGGVKGVLTHHSTKEHASVVLNALSYAPATTTEVYVAIAHNDVLAAAFARLLLWSDPSALPQQDDVVGSWRLYLRTWRPGKPHPETWNTHYTAAWLAVHKAG
jgi:hypothetical protein